MKENAKCIKIKSIKAVCGLTKEIREGMYVQVHINLLTGKLYGILFNDFDTYTLYDDKNIVNIYNATTYESMRDLKMNILFELERRGYDNFI